MGVPEAIFAIFAISITIGLPMFTVAVRFALKPLVEAYMQVRRLESDGGRTQELNALRERVAVLENLMRERGVLLEPSPELRALPQAAPGDFSRRVR